MRSMLGAAFIAAGALLTGVATAEAQSPITVEKLLEDGWEIAGYAGTFDNRSSMLLLRHKDKHYLVQCSILYDVTRSPRLITNCYEVH